MVLGMGLAVWLVGLVFLPAPLAGRILLLAPLVIVPRLLGQLPPRRWITGLGGWPSFLAALPLVAAFAVPAGPAAVVAALPWLALALVGAVATTLHAVPLLPALLRPGRWPELAVDVALGFLAIGAAFLVADRAGAQPMGFSSTVILLTAVHFHFAGFGLLAAAALRAARTPAARLIRFALAGMAAGMPITALGFIVASGALGAVGAVIVGGSGLAVAAALLAGGRLGPWRWAERAAALALLVGMPMGIAWSVAILVGATFVDLDTMVRTHGALNAVAVALMAVAEGGPDA